MDAGKMHNFIICRFVVSLCQSLSITLLHSLSLCKPCALWMPELFCLMLIDLTQHATRCSDSSGQAQEYLIARHAAVETETVLVQICLELGAPSVICSLKECFQITDCLVYPMQIICFVFLCVQFHTFQIQVASVTVAFYLRFRHKILVDDL